MSKHRDDGPRIPIKDCIKGRVYSIGSRNLSIGIYNGEEGFIGIRTKFGTRFLDSEEHWDQGEPYGTVFRVEDTIKIDVPEDIEIIMYLPSEDTSELKENTRLFKFLEEIENTKAS